MSTTDVRATDRTLPPPPRPLTPRLAVRMARTSIFGPLLLAVGLAFFAGGVLFTALSVASQLRDRRLVRDGASATATVEAKDQYTTSTSSRNSHLVHHYTVRVRFPVAGGADQVVSDEIRWSDWLDTSVGDHLDVRYDPAAPKHMVILQDYHPFRAFLGLDFPLLFVLIGATGLAIAIHFLMGPIRLYRRGELARASIRRFDIDKSVRVNGRNPVRIHYAYRDGTGTEREGRTRTLDLALVEAMTGQSEATVLFDPLRPDQSILVAALKLPEAR